MAQTSRQKNMVIPMNQRDNTRVHSGINTEVALTTAASTILWLIFYLKGCPAPWAETVILSPIHKTGGLMEQEAVVAIVLQNHIAGRNAFRECVLNSTITGHLNGFYKISVVRTQSVLL